MSSMLVQYFFEVQARMFVRRFLFHDVYSSLCERISMYLDPRP